MLKPIGNYNKLPKNFKAPAPLKKGEVATYRFVEDLSRPDPQHPGKLRWPEIIKIPVVDSILLDYKDDDGTERRDMFDIGIVTRVDKDNVPTVESFWIRANAAGGEFTFTGGNLQDEKRYYLCELSNYNASNPNRDASISPKYCRVNVEGEAEAENKQLDLELECLLMIRSSTPKEIKQLAAAFNWNENEPVEVLRRKLNQFAKEDPKKFTHLATSKDVEVKATIKRAEGKVIKYVANGHKVAWAEGGATISTLPKVEGMSWIDLFSEWIKTSGKNGTATYENIQKQLETN